jgi:hypothetical protein
MNSLRCAGLMLVVLLSACDADKPPAPPPKVTAAAPAPVPEAKAVQAPAPVPAPVPVPTEPEKPAPVVHQMAPNVAAVPVVAASKAAPAKTEVAKKISTPAKAAAVEKKNPSANARSAKVKADNAEVANRAPVASKTKPAAQVVKETRLPKAKLDLSLPPDMVKQLTPPPNVITAGNKAKSPPAGSKPLLPKMFPDTNAESDFQLQGRLLSNEMELQLRNEARKEVDGAALDFKFKQ